MTAKLTLDGAGRVLIPKPLRDQLRLEPGAHLQLHSEGERITLEPIRPSATIKKERGVWVYQGEPTDASIPDLIDAQRQKRIRETLA